MLPASYQLSCAKCNKNYPLETRHWRCPSCGSPFSLRSECPPATDFKSMLDGRERGLWRYRGCLPFSEHPVSLGEGGTPTIRRRERDAELLLKLEYCNPTGSFKDRGASVSITRARAIGVKRVVEDSTGNAGMAASAYSAKAGIRARIYVPSDALPAKKTLIRACRAEVVECSSRKEAAARATSELAEGELYVGHTWDPFYIEGMKTAAFEIYESGFKADSVILPVASGTLLLGLYKGFGELVGMGFSENTPRIYAVQGEGCAPIYEAIHGKLSGDRSSQLADALKIEDPPRKEEILQAIKSTGGDAFTVSDPEIAAATKELYGLGILAEPSSATAYAAYKKNREALGGRIIIPVTGTGLKTIDRLGEIFGQPH
ncbi:MAG: pyridoxal-phosphate dependent enzyme [Candidatus Verstraetearchaeota archaeon]|nr:pyridoxal-phosphate dependent enzyme [Candidatus Verstraetearchaeota archaeon]